MTKTATKERAYAVDLGSPVHYVAVALDTAAPAAVSERTLLSGYRHGLTADLGRVRHHEDGVNSDSEANAWMVREAIRLLGKQNIHISEGENGERLVGFVEGRGFDNLRWNGKKLTRPEPDPHAILGDAFNPMSGKFSENIRRFTGKDSMTELRESMKAFGWIAEFPGIQDERGVLLVGHRRLAVAKELGIEPVIKTVVLGKGDAADAQRFKLALASNIGAKPLTPEERKEIAVYLYKDHEWTMTRIAEVLSVSQATVSGDLSTVDKSKSGQRMGRPKKPKPEPKAPDEVQHQASVNTTPEDWETFKELNALEGKSTAAVLGEVVKEKVRNPAQPARIRFTAAIEEHPSPDDPLRRLIDAWEAAPEEAKAEFRQLISAKE